MKKLFIFSLMPVLCGAALFFMGCAPCFHIEVMNETSEILCVHVVFEQANYQLAVNPVAPNSTFKGNLKVSIANAKDIEVFAKNGRGDIVFNKCYTREEFLGANCCITITSSQ